MKVIKTVKGIPHGRYEWSALQREIIAKMISTGLYHQAALARHLGVSRWTLNKTLRGRRGNPHVLKKLLRFLGKEPEVVSLDTRRRAGDGRRSAA